MPEIISCEALNNRQKADALDIWNIEYPAQLRMDNIHAFEAFLAQLSQPQYLLLESNDKELIGWAALFNREDARCFFLMLKSREHGKGYGTMLLNALQASEQSLFGWAVDHSNYFKTDGTPYRSPISFYLKSGFAINKGLRLETDLLSAVNISWQRG